MGEQIPQVLVDRMVALVRRCADSAMASGDLYTMREASAIVAELPAPIDPDLLIAREVAAAHRYRQPSPNGARDDILAGRYDDWDCVQVTLAAIKRIRSENNHG